MVSSILVVVDATAAGMAAAREGVSFAAAQGAEVVFYAALPRYVDPVVDMPMAGLPSPEEFVADARRLAEATLAHAGEIAQAEKVAHRTVLDADGSGAAAICRAAEQQHCGLIVVGNPGRHGWSRLLGAGVVLALLAESALPLLVVHEAPAGDGTPPRRPWSRRRGEASG